MGSSVSPGGSAVVGPEHLRAGLVLSERSPANRLPVPSQGHPTGALSLGLMLLEWAPTGQGESAFGYTRFVNRASNPAAGLKGGASTSARFGQSHQKGQTLLWCG